jgi:hypothetical protein
MSASRFQQIDMAKRIRKSRLFNTFSERKPRNFGTLQTKTAIDILVFRADNSGGNYGTQNPGGS